MEKITQFFIVINDGLFLKGRYNGYEKSWTNNIKEAKFFKNKKQAITQIGFWCRTYPQKPIPVLIPINIEYNFNTIIYGEKVNIDLNLERLNNRIKESNLKRNAKKLKSSIFNIE